MDAGGVRKEFFQLLLAALLDPMYSMFLHNPETRTVWLNPGEGGATESLVHAAGFAYEQLLTLSIRNSGF